jgi:hypothetical protein
VPRAPKGRNSMYRTGLDCARPCAPSHRTLHRRLRRRPQTLGSSDLHEGRARGRRGGLRCDSAGSSRGRSTRRTARRPEHSRRTARHVLAHVDRPEPFSGGRPAPGSVPPRRLATESCLRTGPPTQATAHRRADLPSRPRRNGSGTGAAGSRPRPRHGERPPTLSNWQRPRRSCLAVVL